MFDNVAAGRHTSATVVPQQTQRVSPVTARPTQTQPSPSVGVPGGALIHVAPTTPARTHVTPDSPDSPCDINVTACFQPITFKQGINANTGW